MFILQSLVENINIKFKLFLLLQLLYFNAKEFLAIIFYGTENMVGDVLRLEPIIVQSGPKVSIQLHILILSLISSLQYITDCNLITKPNWVLKTFLEIRKFEGSDRKSVV